MGLFPDRAPSGVPGTTELMSALGRLDRRLEAAAAHADRMCAQQGPGTVLRGLYLERSDVDRLFDRQPGHPQFGIDDPYPLVGTLPTGPWRTLSELCALSPFDLDVLLIAFAPELDLRYERLYAYLQDDLTRKRPTVDLALDLLCRTAASKLEHRTRFAPDAPLVGGGLLRLIHDPNEVEPPLLSRYLKLDEQVVALLLEQDVADPRLAGLCDVLEPAAKLLELGIPTNVTRVLTALVDAAQQNVRALRLHLSGPPGAGARRVAESLAGHVGARLARVDLTRVVADARPFETVLPLALREATWRGALPYLAGTDTLRPPERALERRCLEEALAGSWPPVVVLSGERPWEASQAGAGVISVPLASLDFTEASVWWHRTLTCAGVLLENADVEAVAGRFRLGADEIEQAVTHAVQAAEWRALEDGSGLDVTATPTRADLLAGARARSGRGLAELARKIEPHHGWDDIVLPADTAEQLREITERLIRRHRVLEEWGFGRRLSPGLATTALFTGPSGTGKTMAAEILAGDVGLDLYAIDLSGVVSKYIGETEKNLARVFASAERSGAILFFDEADALFGKRSEVRDSHDRYANIETAYLLQRMEQYDGLAILATNLRGNLDESFLRRLAFTVYFPFPEEDDRRRIWRRIWPDETPVGPDLDVDLLAREFKLSGGNIRNVALAAAFLAATDRAPVSMRHVAKALRREYQKLGRPLDDAEWLSTGTRSAS